MRSLLRHIMIAMLAVQLPLCCCEVRAAVASLAHVGHTADEDEASDDCCAKVARKDCCSHGTESASVSDQHGRSVPAEGDCCITCKDRAAPTIAPSIDLDTIHALNFVASVVLATPAPADDAALRFAALNSRHTGPPGAPGGRATLTLHSTLVI